MGALQRQQHQETYIETWIDCYLSEYKQAGYVVVFDKGKHHKESYYGQKDKEYLKRMAKTRKKDVYLSLNAFSYGSRSSEHLKQIRNVGIDLDCYNVGISQEQTETEIQRLIEKGKIPNPNLFIKSGQGIQLVYSISGGLPSNMAFLTQYITSHLINLTKHLGADPKCTDVSRVFRLPGTTNSKNGQKVTVKIWRNLEYGIQELSEFCPPMAKTKDKPKTERKVLPYEKPGVKSVFSLNTKRKEDLRKLVSLRNGDLTGLRNEILYIFAYTTALIDEQLGNTRYHCYDFLESVYSVTDKPLKKSEIENTIKSAWKDGRAFIDEWNKRDNKMWYSRNDGIIKPMKTKTIIERLNVTNEESRSLATIHTTEILKENDREQKRQARRKAGVKVRAEYNQERENIIQGHMERIRAIQQEQPGIKQKEIAEMTGLSTVRVSQLIKEIRKS